MTPSASETLEWVARLQGVDPDRDKLQQALRRQQGDPASPAIHLSQLAAGAGLRLTVAQRSLAQILPQLHPTHPWLLARHTGDGRLEALVLLAARGRKVHCLLPHHHGKPGWISRQELLDWAGTNSEAAELECLITEPLAPLAQMRSTGHAEKSPWERLQGLLAVERTTLTVAIIYSIVIGLLSLVVPVAVQSLVNTIAFGSVLQPLVVLTLFVFLALGFSAAMNTMRAFVVEILQRSVFARVGSDITWRLLHVRAEAFDTYHGPELVNRFFDVVTVQKSAASLLIDGLNILMQTLIGLVLVALYHPILLAFDVFLVAAMVLILFVMGRGAVYTSIKESKAKYAFQAWLEQIATHLVTFKSAGGMELATARSQSLLEDYLHYREKHFKILIRQIAGSFVLQALASSLLLGIGGYLVINRQLSLGQLVASELIVTLMVSGFTKFGKQLEVFYDLQAAMDKLGGLVDLPLERAGGEGALRATGPAGLRISRLELGHEGSSHALHIGHWEMRPGDRIGLIGQHGAGKSTLAEALFGLRTPSSGTILLDGVEYRDLALDEIRRHVALVRGAEIFSGTLLENVRLGRAELSHAEIAEALRVVGILNDVRALPNGMDTQLHPSGRPLSQSQTYRLMLARAIAGQPRLLILDDALDALDRPDERDLLKQVLFAPSAPWTLLCMTERPDLLEGCNRIVTLAGGDLTESQSIEVRA